MTANPNKGITDTRINQEREVRKVLGQLGISTANTPTDLYTVPANTSSVISSIVATNRSNMTHTFRVAIRRNGASLADSQYIRYDKDITRRNSEDIKLGITLSENDIITVEASTTDFSFSAFGVELVQ